MKGKRRTTFEKLNRERAVRERRALKQERKEQRKLEARESSEAAPEETPDADATSTTST